MTADTSPQALLISGSERPGGNTDQAVDYARRTLEAHGAHADIACLRDHRIETCGSCGDCNYRPAAKVKSGPCL